MMSGVRHKPAMSTIRLASISDSAQIVKLLQSGLPAQVLPLTIYGVEAIARYIGDSIRYQDFGESLFCVCDDGGRLLGFAEFRRLRDSIFLNHIYVLAGARGQGIGTRLLRDGLQRLHQPARSELLLDVFSDNQRAQHWYAALGLEVEFEQTWMVFPLAQPGAKALIGWTALGLPQADVVHGRYGFSQFRLQTPSGAYDIGRLGAAFFRSSSLAVLDDPAAMQGLASLDAGCKLLCIAPSATTRLAAMGVVVAQSQRRRGAIAGVISKLQG